MGLLPGGHPVHHYPAEYDAQNPQDRDGTARLDVFALDVAAGKRSREPFRLALLTKSPHVTCESAVPVQNVGRVSPDPAQMWQEYRECRRSPDLPCIRRIDMAGK